MTFTVDEELSSDIPSACIAASDVEISALSPPAAKIMINDFLGKTNKRKYLLLKITSQISLLSELSI